MNTCKTDGATFGAGCFWDSEAAFRHLYGVLSTRVGFMGGTTPCPSYEEVCEGITGHWEVVQVEYDPSRISYTSLLETFWETVDSFCSSLSPAENERFQPAIFYHSLEQKRHAQASCLEWSRRGRQKHACRGKVHLAPASEFCEAEEHHQQFYEKCGKGYAAQSHYYE